MRAGSDSSSQLNETNEFLLKERDRRNQTFSWFMVLGGSFFLMFGIVACFEHRVIQGLMEILIFLMGPAYILTVRKTKSALIPSILILTAVAAFFLYLAAFREIHYSMWIFVFPLLAMFLLEAFWGLITAGAFFFILATLFLLPDTIVPTQYPFDLRIRILGSFFSVTLLAYIFETTRGRYQAWLLGSNRQLQQALLQLKTTTDALSESEAKYRNLIERAADGIAILQDDVIVFCNNHMATMLGYIPQDILSTPVSVHMLADEREKMAGQLKELEQGRETPTVFKSTLCDRHGKSIAVEINSGPIVFNGRAAALLIIRDISSRLLMEEQLRMAQKMDAIGQLAGGVAHDFNNMISAISGYAELLQNKISSDQPNLLRYASTIFQTARRAGDITNKLLNFARKGSYEMVPVDLHVTLQDTVKLLEHTIDKRIKIVQELQADTFVVIGDRSQLQNAFLNLSVNARDAMPNGGELRFTTKVVTIEPDRLGLENSGTAGMSAIAILISDTGTGIPPEVKKRLFEPFMTTKAPGKGTGLGLASVYGIVKSHHGNITVDSEVGHGTRFTIYLPLASDAKMKTVMEEHAPPAPGRGHVLVVDDEESMRSLCNDYLHNLGYTTTCCANGKEAVHYYTAHHGRVDVVVLDVIMPEMNGYDCFQALKQINPDVKVIITSGYPVVDGNSRQILDNGARCFVQKPFVMRILAEAIASALNDTPAIK